MPKIIFLNNNSSFAITEDMTILEAALELDMEINNDCGANGVCGTCCVHIENGREFLNDISEEEIELLEMFGHQPGSSRLACQTRTHGDVSVTIPDE